MSLPITEYFYVNEQDYHIEVTVDSTLRSDSENPVESDVIQAAIDSGAITDLSRKQYKQLAIPVVVGGTQKDTIEGAIQGLADLRTSVPSSGSTKLMTAEAAYTDKVGAPIDSDTRNLTAQNLAAFFMNSPTPESWLGKVLGPKLGKSWTQGIGAPFEAYAVTCANGLWNTGNAWSADGKTWTAGTGGIASKRVITISFANNIWVAGTEGGYGVWWSEDGKVWTQGTGTSDEITRAFVLSVKYANGVWVAACYDDGLWYSVDGKTWTRAAWFPGYDDSGMYFYGLCYAEGLWSAGIAWSTDGITWARTASGYGSRAIVYANGLWNTGDAWSTDGKTWTAGTGGISNVFSLAYGNGMWVAGTRYGCWWSTDGKAWNKGSNVWNQGDIPPLTGIIHAVFYANGIWVAADDGQSSWWAAEDSRCWWSADGKNWTLGIGSASAMHSVHYTNGMWIAGSENNGCYYSDVKDFI